MQVIKMIISPGFYHFNENNEAKPIIEANQIGLKEWK